ncbi:MAG: hypothetical protein PVH52_02860 [bacterium]|jgi:hypothetical protein
MQVLYRNTQMGWSIIVPVEAVALFCLYLALAKGVLIAGFLFFFLLILTYLFYSLTVTGTAETLELKFGVGLVRKKFKLAEIMTAQPHRTKWWDGWGIHYTTQGLLFNVSGFDAVKITMKNGRRYIIGTNDPGGLLLFIQSHRK